MSDARKPPTTSQLRKDLLPAASPLGTDDEAADTTPSEVRAEMAQKAVLDVDITEFLLEPRPGDELPPFLERGRRPHR